MSDWNTEPQRWKTESWLLKCYVIYCDHFSLFSWNARNPWNTQAFEKDANMTGKLGPGNAGQTFAQIFIRTEYWI